MASPGDGEEVSWKRGAPPIKESRPEPTASPRSPREQSVELSALCIFAISGGPGGRTWQLCGKPTVAANSAGIGSRVALSVPLGLPSLPGHEAARQLLVVHRNVPPQAPHRAYLLKQPSCVPGRHAIAVRWPAGLTPQPEHWCLRLLLHTRLDLRRFSHRPSGTRVLGILHGQARTFRWTPTDSPVATWIPRPLATWLMPSGHLDLPVRDKPSGSSRISPRRGRMWYPVLGRIVMI